MAMLEDLHAEVEKRSRFTQILSLVEPPTPDELTAAIYDALDDINLYAPQTNFTLEEIVEMQDTRWKRMLILGAAKNTVGMLVRDWTANGLDVDLGDGVALQSKLGDYNSLHDSLKTEFDDLITKLKASALKISKVSMFSTKQALGAYSAYKSRASQYRKSSKV